MEVDLEGALTLHSKKKKEEEIEHILLLFG